MDYERTFKPQMNRLAAAYRLEIPATTMAAYWTVFSGSDDARFSRACERALESERAFPAPAALKAIMRTAAEVGMRLPGESHHTARPIAVAALDLNSVRPEMTPHRPGTRSHDGWLKVSKRLTETLTALLTKRLDELEADPHNADLERRVSVIGRTLAHQEQWHEHFARTGESLVWEVTL